ncbi:hypothetical protein GCM10009730_61200 [Streptomyces albidochromogenes]|uniref:hypothetical protein n=1 Tax=Streptomyces albidochromogenes TaxID=329524 RepID=UPI002FEC47BD
MACPPQTNPFAPARRTYHTFEQTVQLLELFLHHEGRAPTARETIIGDGDTVKIGPWFAKARTKHRSSQLDTGHERLLAALFDGGLDRRRPGPRLRLTLRVAPDPDERHSVRF